jgi:hypothetical protein
LSLNWDDAGILPNPSSIHGITTVIAYSPLGTTFANMKAVDQNGVLTRVAKSTAKTEALVALNWVISSEQVVTIAKSQLRSTLLRTAVHPRGGFRGFSMICSAGFRGGSLIVDGFAQR